MCFIEKVAEGFAHHILFHLGIGYLFTAEHADAGRHAFGAVGKCVQKNGTVFRQGCYVGVST